jgi:hypothetical protein
MFSILPSTSIPVAAGGVLAREGENVTIFVPANEIAGEPGRDDGLRLERTAARPRSKVAHTGASATSRSNNVRA